METHRRGAIGTDQRRVRHDRRRGKPLRQLAVEFAIGRTFGERVDAAVEGDDMHEADAVVEHQHLILDSAGISSSQLEQHVLNQLTVPLRTLLGRDVMHYCGSLHCNHLHEYRGHATPKFIGGGQQR